MNKFRILSPVVIGFLFFTIIAFFKFNKSDARLTTKYEITWYTVIEYQHKITGQIVKFSLEAHLSGCVPNEYKVLGATASLTQGMSCFIIPY